MNPVFSLFQLNIQKGCFLPEIIRYVENNPFDVLTLQEVTGGTFSKNGDDTFTVLKDTLGYEGEMIVDLIDQEQKENYFGSAILFSPSVSLLQKREIRPSPLTYVEIKKHDDWKKIVRSGLALTVTKDSVPFEVVTTHGAWSNSPYDTPEKIKQAEVISTHLQALDSPFIFAADLNVVSDTEVIRLYEKYATNLTKRSALMNTLNPKIHYVPGLFPAGLAVDFIFASPRINVKEFALVDSPDLSDHYGLRTVFEIE